MLRYNERTGEFEEVRNIPQIIEFETQTQTIFEGEPFIVKWKVDNASIIEINGERSQECIGEKKLTCDFTGTKQITLIARNDTDSINRHLQVNAIPKPEFNLVCTPSKIRRNSQESCNITWDIKNAISAQIYIDNNKEDITLKGNKEIKPSTKTIVKLSAVSLDQRTEFTDECVIEIFNPSKVSFACNKKFSFARLPVVLSWETKDCLEVELVGVGPQPLTGSITLCPEVTTDYILRVTDNFETKDYTLKVQMLPLPLIKSVLIEAPKLEHEFPISYKTPQFVTVPSIPAFENEFSKLEIPHIPDLKDSGYAVEMMVTPRRRLSKKISKMFNHIFNK